MDYEPKVIPDGWKVELLASSGSDKIKIWDSEKAQQIEAPITYTIGTDTIPAYLYIQGLDVGAVILDLVLRRPDSTELYRDKIQLTTYMLRITKVGLNDDTGEYEIYGSVRAGNPEGFQHYKVEFGAGMEPTTWMNVDSGSETYSQMKNNELLATWDRTGYWDAYCTIRRTMSYKWGPETKNSYTRSILNRGNIVGKVTDTNGNPISGITVVANKVDNLEDDLSEEVGLSCSVTTDDQGNYTFRDFDGKYPLDAGVYLLNLSPEGEDDYTYKRTNFGEIEVVGYDETADKNFTLANVGISLSGHVKDVNGNPIPSAIVQIEQSDGTYTGFGQTVTDANGNYVFNKVDAPALYNVFADAEGYIARNMGNAASIGSGQSIAVSDIVLYDAGRITGTVKDLDDNPIEGVTVYAVHDGDMELCVRSAVTAADGTYTIMDLDTDTVVPYLYNITAKKEGYISWTNILVPAVSGDSTTSDFELMESIFAKKFDTNIQEIQRLAKIGNTTNNDDEYKLMWMPSTTHRWIVKMAVDILKNDGYSNIFNFLYSQYPVKKLPQINFLCNGAEAADVVKATGYNAIGTHGYHPWRHTGWKNVAGYSAADNCTHWFSEAISEWLNGNRALAMHRLGMALHYVGDVAVPFHASVTYDVKRQGRYEEHAEANQEDNKVSKGGIYGFNPLNANHYNDGSSRSWIDFGAHHSFPLYRGEDNAFDSVPFCLRLAQRTCAGFIKRFFASVGFSR